MTIRVYRNNYNSMLNKYNYIYNFRSSVRQYIRYWICRPFWLFDRSVVWPASRSAHAHYTTWIVKLWLFSDPRLKSGYFPNFNKMFESQFLLTGYNQKDQGLYILCTLPFFDIACKKKLKCNKMWKCVYFLIFDRIK